MRTLALLVLTVSISLSAEIPHLRRVNDHIYTGKQPRPGDYAELAHMGIKTVLDLRGGRFHRPRESKRVQAAGMRYISMRLSGLFPPRDQQVANVLAVLNDPDLWPVFVHCWRGDDRVGLVIACYRMTHDHWTNQRALAEAHSYKLNRLEFLLERYIRHFDPSRPAFREQTAAAATSR